jgi:hypothetical protein
MIDAFDRHCTVDLVAPYPELAGGTLRWAHWVFVCYHRDPTAVNLADTTATTTATSLQPRTRLAASRASAAPFDICDSSAPYLCFASYAAAAAIGDV